MLLTKNSRLRLESDELNIDEMRRMRLKVTRLEEKIKLYKDKMSKNNKLVVAYKLLIVSWIMFFGYLACGCVKEGGMVEGVGCVEGTGGDDANTSDAIV
ncbi:hypothetical protein J1N35_018700 [Gossypium stocksii]|uniref:Uncharacterized protein n=1 Tax=Gossypium stocksii TaxID=47602 RepID=A0A9D3VRQ2_9ROSI|nr:hypothetical protein J1N35_018700 [Gossypium stocksii]